MAKSSETCICNACGTKLADGGPVGLYCPNKECRSDFDQAVSFYRAHRLSRLEREIGELNNADRQELMKRMLKWQG